MKTVVLKAWTFSQHSGSDDAWFAIVDLTPQFAQWCENLIVLAKNLRDEASNFYTLEYFNSAPEWYGVHELLDELDDGRVVRGLEEVLGVLADLLRQMVEVLGRVLGEGVGGARAALLDLVDRGQDGAQVDEIEPNLDAVEEHPQVVDRSDQPPGP